VDGESSERPRSEAEGERPELPGDELRKRHPRLHPMPPDRRLKPGESEVIVGEWIENPDRRRKREG
jgi:hypothetical protein